MLKTDVLEELRVICLRNKISLNKAVEGICYKNSLYRTINTDKVIAKNIVALADKLGYDIEINFVKRD